MENRPYETDDAIGAGDRPFCSQCEGIELRRQGRFGFWQRSVLARLGLFPWECGLCRKIYMLRRRSALCPSGENSLAQGPGEGLKCRLKAQAQAQG
jgi:hypothetical protein